MTIKWIVSGALLLIAIGYFITSNLKSEETIISASFQMQACEGCFHMTVEKSQDASAQGETIIPVSKTVDIEKMIEGIALTKGHLCLRGRFYKFNLDLLKLDPDGKRFEVLAQEDIEACAKL